MLRSAAAVALVLSLGLSGAARAGIYTDDLTKCLVKSTTASDRQNLMVWMFEAMSVHPAVKALSTVTTAQRETTNRTAAGLMERLVTQDCRADTISAVKFEGVGAIQQSFTVLGQVAMGGLMQDPAVAQGMQQMAGYLDGQKFEALGREAGLVTPPKK